MLPLKTRGFVGVLLTFWRVRLNSGVPLRTTDWKAVSDGLFKFMNTSIVTHPGVILGAVDIINLRDTGERLTVPTGYGFAAVRYDDG
jgi:hypothetical protein